MPDRTLSFDDLLHLIFATAMDKVNAIIATLMIFLPAIHPSIKDVSEAAALWTPILGVIWLGIQITSKLVSIFGKKHKHDDEE